MKTFLNLLARLAARSLGARLRRTRVTALVTLSASAIARLIIHVCSTFSRPEWLPTFDTRTIKSSQTNPLRFVTSWIWDDVVRVLTKQTFLGHTSPTHISQGHSGRLAPHTTLSFYARTLVPDRNRAGRLTDTRKYGKTTEFWSCKSTGRLIRPARSGVAPGAGGGRPTHRPRFSSARRAVITAIWPLLTSSVKFFVDFYSWSRWRRFS